MTSIVRLSTAPIVPLGDAVAADRLVRGRPFTGTRPATEDAARGFYTGVWESEPGAWRVAYDEDELCVILAGRVRLTDEAGSSEDFVAGDAFVIPRGYRGVWETIEHLRKVYALLA